MKDACDIFKDMPQVDFYVGDVALSPEMSRQAPGMPGELRARGIGDSDGVALMFLLMFGVIAYVLGNSKYLLDYRLREFFRSKRTYAGASAEINRSEAANTVMLNAVSCMSLAVMMCVGVYGSGAWAAVWGGMGVMGAVWVSFASVLAFVLAKSLLYMLVNSVFFHQAEITKWMSSFFFLGGLCSLLLYPVSLMSVYSDVSDGFVSFCLQAVLVVYEIGLFYRLCVNFRAKSAGYLLIFLYFCSAEVIPLLIMRHFAMNLLGE
jgi:hypothetical protein